MNVGRDDFRWSTNLIHFFTIFATFISRSNHFDGDLELCRQPRTCSAAQTKFKTNLVFYGVFEPGALPNISKTAVCEIVVTISSDLSGEVSQSGEGVGEQDARQYKRPLHPMQ
jgi:hypothetical protein